MYDYVKCNNCNWWGMVDINTDNCPLCQQSALQFLDNNKTTERELKDEFYSLRNDDEKFADQYKASEFEEWLVDQLIIKQKRR